MIALTRMGRIFAICGIGFIVIGMVCFAAGGRINSTRSIPLGLYWLTDAPVKKEDYVIFCPPETAIFAEARHRGYIGAGFCPGGYGYMMKRVVADFNDRVEVTPLGIRINGVPMPASGARKADKAGRTMPRYPLGSYTLGKSELLVMSDVSGTSFDSRYFGPVDASHVKGVIRPVITW